MSGAGTSPPPGADERVTSEIHRMLITRSLLR